MAEDGLAIGLVFAVALVAYAVVCVVSVCSPNRIVETADYSKMFLGSSSFSSSGG